MEVKMAVVPDVAARVAAILSIPAANVERVVAPVYAGDAKVRRMLAQATMFKDLQEPLAETVKATCSPDVRQLLFEKVKSMLVESLAECRNVIPVMIHHVIDRKWGSYLGLEPERDRELSRIIVTRWIELAETKDQLVLAMSHADRAMLAWREGVRRLARFLEEESAH